MGLRICLERSTAQAEEIHETLERHHFHSVAQRKCLRRDARTEFRVHRPGKRGVLIHRAPAVACTGWRTERAGQVLAAELDEPCAPGDRPFVHVMPCLSPYIPVTP